MRVIQRLDYHLSCRAAQLPHCRRGQFIDLPLPTDLPDANSVLMICKTVKMCDKLKGNTKCNVRAVKLAL